MARALVIEQESGTCRGQVHPHNGYYAGDFSATESTVPVRTAHLRVVPAQQADSGTTSPGPVRWRDAA